MSAILNFITLMNDVSSSSKYYIEHGLCFWIEYNSSIFLFDTGQSEHFHDNLRLNDLEFFDVNHIVLSHAHYDHTGGIKKIIDTNLTCEVHVGGTFWDLKYSKNEHEYLYRGIDFTRGEIVESKMSIHEMKAPIEVIDEGVYIIGDIHRNHYFERIDPKFYVERENELIADKFNDEVVLCIDSPKGIIVFVGCGHTGIVNILETVKKYFGKPIYALFGGFHLNGQENEYIKKVADYLSENVEFIGTGHCTGNVAIDYLKKTFGENYLEISVGKEHKVVLSC